MKYETFERIMDEERIAQGTIEFKKYLEQYDFGSGKWDETNNSGYILEKLFHLLILSRDLPNYGEASSILQSIIVEVAQKATIEPGWMREQMERLKLKTYFNEQLIEP